MVVKLLIFIFLLRNIILKNRVLTTTFFILSVAIVFGIYNKKFILYLVLTNNEIKFKSICKISRSGGMVDAVDSKSTGDEP